MRTVPIDLHVFRGLVRNVPGQVSLIATALAGRRVGSIASAVCSLTDDPPTVIVCVDREACAHDLIIESGVFSVNALAAAQAKVARAFSGPGGPIEHGDWSTGVTGAPVLAATVCRLECRLTEWRAASAHTVLFGQVVAGSASPDAEPLLQLRGAYVGTERRSGLELKSATAEPEFLCV